MIDAIPREWISYTIYSENDFIRARFLPSEIKGHENEIQDQLTADLLREAFNSDIVQNHGGSQ